MAPQEIGQNATGILGPAMQPSSNPVGPATCHDTLAILWRHRITAIVRAERARLAADAMDAAVRGGIRCVEFTLTTPDAYRLINEFAQRRVGDEEERLSVGAGTVLRPDQAHAAVKAGATFLVSPVMDPEIIATAARLGVAVIPGVNTPTEMLAAHRLGAPLLKLFPAPAGGPAWLRSVLAPLPFLRVVPTNGVDVDNLAAWLDAGAWSVGLVRSLFPVEDLAARRWDAIEQRARAAVAAAATVRRDVARPIDAIPDPMVERAL